MSADHRAPRTIWSETVASRLISMARPLIGALWTTGTPSLIARMTSSGSSGRRARMSPFRLAPTSSTGMPACNVDAVDDQRDAIAVVTEEIAQLQVLLGAFDRGQFQCEHEQDLV